MKNIGYCFLAIGDRYVDEFLSIAKYFPKENIIVCSDRKISDYNTIVTKKPFNFNLKALALKKAFKKYNNVVLLDTDHFITSLNKNVFSDIPYGISVKWVGGEVEYLSKSINSLDLMNGSTEFDDVNIYGKKLYELSKLQPQFIDESIIIFNFENNSIKDNFIKNLLNLIQKTEGMQPFRYTDKKMGALEGCIIYLAAILSNIEISTKKSDDLNKYFYHYGPKIGHDLKLNQNKSLL